MKSLVQQEHNVQASKGAKRDLFAESYERAYVKGMRNSAEYMQHLRGTK